MTRYQHRPWTVPNSIFSHVIIDTVTGRDIAWCCSLSDADTAVRLRNEDEDDSGMSYEEIVAALRVSDVLGEQLERELLRTLELGDAARAARAATPSGLSQSSVASCQHRIAIAKEERVTKLIETDSGLLSKGVWETVTKLRNIADSFERDHMPSSAGAMREAVEVIIELESKLRRQSKRTEA